MTSVTPRRLRLNLCLVIVVTWAVAAQGQDAASFFRQNCISCHTIGGGRLVGPDLKDVTGRRDRAWLRSFVSNPRSFLEGGDPYALKLKEEARGAVMPNISGIDPGKAEALLTLIEAESKLPKSQFAGLQITDQPFTPKDIAAGRAIFMGRTRLTNGGPACISCHSTANLPQLGGGRLAPDLTRVYERLNGRRNLASWLMAPATLTMRPLFARTALTNEEIVSLVAWLEQTARQPNDPAADTSTLSFFFLGLGGSVAGFIGADAIWRKRFRGVRKQMVEKSRRGQR